MPQAGHSQKQKLKRFCKFICGPVLPLSLASGVALLFLVFLGNALAANSNSQSLLEKELSAISGTSGSSQNILSILQRISLNSYLGKTVRIPIPSDNPAGVPGGDTDYLYLIPPQIFRDRVTGKLYATKMVTNYFASGKSISKEKADYVRDGIDEKLNSALANTGLLRTEIKKILFSSDKTSYIHPDRGFSSASLFSLLHSPFSISFIPFAHAEDTATTSTTPTLPPLDEQSKNAIVQQLLASNDPAAQQTLSLLMLSLIYDQTLANAAAMEKTNCLSQGGEWVNDQCQKKAASSGTTGEAATAADSAANNAAASGNGNANGNDNSGDDDKDGVANPEDGCPGTSSWDRVVGAGSIPGSSLKGCSCSQLETMGMFNSSNVTCPQSQCEGNNWVEYPQSAKYTCESGVVFSADCSPTSRVPNQVCANSQNSNSNDNSSGNSGNDQLSQMLGSLAKSLLGGGGGSGGGGSGGGGSGGGGGGGGNGSSGGSPNSPGSPDSSPTAAGPNVGAAGPNVGAAGVDVGAAGSPTTGVGGAESYAGIGAEAPGPTNGIVGTGAGVGDTAVMTSTGAPAFQPVGQYGALSANDVQMYTDATARVASGNASALDYSITGTSPPSTGQAPGFLGNAANNPAVADLSAIPYNEGPFGANAIPVSTPQEVAGLQYETSVVDSGGAYAPWDQSYLSSTQPLSMEASGNAAMFSNTASSTVTSPTSSMLDSSSFVGSQPGLSGYGSSMANAPGMQVGSQAPFQFPYNASTGTTAPSSGGTTPGTGAGNGPAVKPGSFDAADPSAGGAGVESPGAGTPSSGGTTPGTGAGNGPAVKPGSFDAADPSAGGAGVESPGAGTPSSGGTTPGTGAGNGPAVKPGSFDAADPSAGGAGVESPGAGTPSSGGTTPGTGASGQEETWNSLSNDRLLQTYSDNPYLSVTGEEAFNPTFYESFDPGLTYGMEEATSMGANVGEGVWGTQGSVNTFQPGSYSSYTAGTTPTGPTGGLTGAPTGYGPTGPMPSGLYNGPLGGGETTGGALGKGLGSTAESAVSSPAGMPDAPAGQIGESLFGGAESIGSDWLLEPPEAAGRATVPPGGEETDTEESGEAVTP